MEKSKILNNVDGIESWTKDLDYTIDWLATDVAKTDIDKDILRHRIGDIAMVRAHVDKLIQNIREEMEED